MKIYYTNLHSYNGISEETMENLINEVENNKPDVIVLTEFSCQKSGLKLIKKLEESMGYKYKHNGLVLVASKFNIAIDEYDHCELEKDQFFLNGRFLSINLAENLKIVDVYVPPYNRSIEMSYECQVRKRIEPYINGILKLAEKSSDKDAIFLGDFNPYDFNHEDNVKLSNLTNCKLEMEKRDFTSIVNVPTFANCKQLDFIFVSKSLLVKMCNVSISVKKINFSDHKAIIFEYNVEKDN